MFFCSCTLYCYVTISSDMFCIITVFLLLSCFFLTEISSFFFAAILLISCPIITFSTPLSLLHLSFLLASSLFCKLAALVRHRTSLFGKDGENKTYSDFNLHHLFSCLSLPWFALCLATIVYVKSSVYFVSANTKM